MDEQAELISLAEKCRRLADGISDGPARENLLRLAAEYEARVDSETTANENVPLMLWDARD